MYNPRKPFRDVEISNGFRRDVMDAVNGPDIKAENDFGVTKVKTVTSSTKSEECNLRYSFPAYSNTMHKAKLV